MKLKLDKSELDTVANALSFYKKFLDSDMLCDIPDIDFNHKDEAKLKQSISSILKRIYGW